MHCLVLVSLLLGFTLANVADLLPVSPEWIDAESLSSMLHAANQGHSSAMYLLAMAKLYGHGLEKDEVEAVKLLKRAAEENHIDAQFALGVLYETGVAVSPSDHLSHNWFSSSAHNGHLDAKWKLALIYAEGRGVLRDTEKAVRLLTEAGAMGSHRAMFYLAILYEYGRGVPLDFAKASELYEAASEDNRLVEAMYHLGLMHLYGRGKKRNSAIAKELFEKAAERDFTPAMLALGHMYALGDGLEVNYTMALYWLKRSTEGEEWVKKKAEATIQELEGLMEEVEAHIKAQEKLYKSSIQVHVATIDSS